MKVKEIEKFVENMDSSEANYCYGYIKGFHNIKENSEKENAVRDMEREKERAIKSLRLMKDRYDLKCKENDELKRHCEQLAYMSFKRQYIIDELVGMDDEE